MFTPKAELTEVERRSFAQTVVDSLRAIPAVKRAVVARTRDLATSYPNFVGHQTYHYAAIVEFDNEAGLRAYFEHPLHGALAAQFWHYCGGATILDLDGGDVTEGSLTARLV